MTNARLAAHFEDMAKQTHAARLGMWVFLGSEALLFSGLFTLYASYRVAYPDEFAEAVRHTNLLLGTLMTFVLIISSYFMVLAVSAGRSGFPKASLHMLLVTFALGVVFLVLKATEYTMHFRDGIFPGKFYRDPLLPGYGANIFFTLYYFMTGLHALHVLGGLTLISWLAWKTRRLALGPDYYTPLELGGMYWHFVDIIWLFLWPLFYLLH